MSVILGINSHHASASAALVIDGRLVAAIPEERLNRVKYYGRFPKLAVAECLRIGGVGMADVEHVALGRNPAANRWQKIGYAARQVGAWPNFLRMLGKKRGLEDLRVLFAEQFGLEAG